MDFTECLKTGSMLTTAINNIAYTKSTELYGLFPEFTSFLKADAYEEGVARLGQVDREAMDGIVARIPRDWDVPEATREAIVQFLVQRATFLVDEFLPGDLYPHLVAQKEFPES